MKKSITNLFSGSILCLSVLLMLPFVVQSCKSMKEQQPVRNIVVSLKYNGKFWLGKPPLATVYFDLEASNSTSAFKWLLLPTFLGDGGFSPGGVYSVRRLLNKGDGEQTVLFKIGAGTDGYYAIPLPSGSQVKLTNLEIGDYDWPKSEASLTMAYALTAEIKIESPQLQAVLSNAAQLPQNDFSVDFADLQPGGSANMDDLKDSPTQYVDTSMHAVVVKLK